jgi:hypothetical protein
VVVAVIAVLSTLLFSAFAWYTVSDLEQKLGPDVTCLFFQGGAGDINPLIEGVRQRLRNGQPVRAIGDVSSYYGELKGPQEWSIGDRLA